MVLENDSEKKLIESIYNVAVDPQNYQNFIERWTEEFLQFPDEISQRDNDAWVARSEAISQTIGDHFLRAYDILELLDLNTDQDKNLSQQIETAPLPTLLVAQDKTISVINLAAQNKLKLSVNNGIEDISISAEIIDEVNALFDKFEGLETDKVLTIIQVSVDQNTDSIIFAISKVIDLETKINHLKFSAVDAIWSDDIGQIIQHTFDLTNGELDVAQKLVNGKKLAEIAQEKNRSILTVRTQSKSLYKKTRLKSQSDLIKLFIILQNLNQRDSDNSVSSVPSHSDVTRSQHVLTREQGRKLYYEVYGHRSGEPVLFLHGLITGTDLTEDNIEYLHQNKIKLIAPHRAGFGHSDPLINGDYLTEFGADITAVLAAENVKKCKILGHSMGSYYAYYLGTHLANKFSKITIVSGAVPFTSMAQISKLHKRQRILTYTGKFTPQLLPFVLRGSAMQVKKYGAEDLIEALYKDSPFDYHLLTDPKYRDVLIKGFEASFRQGVGSILADGVCLHGDGWDDLVSSCKLPIRLFHGQHNQAVPVQQVQDFIDQHNKLSLTIIDSGQLIFYEFIDTVMADI